VEVSGLLLDTSAYSAIRRGDRRLLEPIQEASELFLTPVVIGELLYGFLGGRLEAKNRGLLREFVASPRVGVLPLDEETGERYAVIRDYLRRQGKPVPVNDLWISASAAQHGLRVLTLDEHFKSVPHVLIEYFDPLA
jgi:tRNA(fMet)-specific endonuclease VapC